MNGEGANVSEDVDVKIRSYSRSLKDLHESMCSVGDKANFKCMSAVNYESYRKCAPTSSCANEPPHRNNGPCCWITEG